MDYRKKKQIKIAVIFFIIAGFIAFLTYLAARTPANCFDGIQNKDEEGVDCGGICEKTCELEKEELKVILSKLIPTLPDTYNVIFKIYNPNEGYGASDLKYAVRFFDKTKSLVHTYDGELYILPRNIKTTVISALNIRGEPRSIEVVFREEPPWIQLNDYKAPPQISIKNKFYQKLFNQTAFSEVRGVAVNRSDFDFDKVNINIFLLDSNKNIIDAMTTEIRTLLSGEEREFIAHWFYPAPDPVSTEVEAETNVFRSENFMKRHGALEKFQKL